MKFLLEDRCGRPVNTTWAWVFYTVCNLLILVNP